MAWALEVGSPPRLYGLAYIGYFFSKKKSGGDVSTNPSGHSLHPSGMSLKA